MHLPSLPVMDTKMYVFKKGCYFGQNTIYKFYELVEVAIINGYLHIIYQNKTFLIPFLTIL
jgi:hypothetical protein